MFFAYTPDGRRWAYADGVWSWISSQGGQVPCVSSEADQRRAIIQECREACLHVGASAHDAAKLSDATDYMAGYQDAAVDCDEALMDLLPSPSDTEEKGDG